MTTFFRGARVKKPVLALDRELTMVEASFVMCSVAERYGYKTEEKFLEYMKKAWYTYDVLAPADTGAEHES